MLSATTLSLAQKLLAVGLDPDRCTLFVQSHVHEHSELAWLMECTVSFGELNRMTQFKDKSGKTDFVSAASVHLPRPDGRRHPRPRHRPGPRRGRPAPAPRDHQGHRRALQRPLRRDVRRTRGLHPQGRRPDHGPAGTDEQDVEVRPVAPGDHRPPRRPRRRGEEDQASRHRLRDRRHLRRGVASLASPTSCRSWPPPRVESRLPSPRATPSSAPSRPTRPRRSSSSSAPSRPATASWPRIPPRRNGCSPRARTRPARRRLRCSPGRRRASGCSRAELSSRRRLGAAPDRHPGRPSTRPRGGGAPGTRR